jgi:hypothetical protein
MPLTVESFAAEGAHPLKAEATRVLVRDAAGNPVCLVVEYTPGAVFCVHIDDDEFEDTLRRFGLEAPRVRRRVEL